jgi:hypothetical protein
MSGIHIGKRRRSDSTQRNKNTQRAETQDTQKRSAERQRGRKAEGERRHSRSSGHPSTGFSGRSDPFSTPHTSRWRPGEPVGRRVGTLRRRPGEPVGVGVGTSATNPGGDRENRWAWWSILEPSPTRAGGDRENRWVRGVQDLLLGGLAIDTRSRV